MIFSIHYGHDSANHHSIFICLFMKFNHHHSSLIHNWYLVDFSKGYLDNWSCGLSCKSFYGFTFHKYTGLNLWLWSLSTILCMRWFCVHDLFTCNVILDIKTRWKIKSYETFSTHKSFYKKEKPANR
jgi:hypothetical protein